MAVNCCQQCLPYPKGLSPRAKYAQTKKNSRTKVLRINSALRNSLLITVSSITISHKTWLLKVCFSGVNSSLSPLQYNSKLMNSVWGMYNRYSVHNLKKNIDADFKFAANQQS